MHSEAVVAKNINKTFSQGMPGEVRALKDISVIIDRGKIAAFIGPSGSGKTTLLSILGCMTKPTSGDLQVIDQQVNKWSEKFLTLFRRKHIGFVFQNFNLIENLTSFQNIMIPLIPLGIPSGELQRRVLKWSERMNLNDRLNFKVGLLSGGEMQRVAFARALVTEPEIIIADEPTSHLDTNLSRDIIQIFEKLKKENKTILIATHDPLIFNSGIIDDTRYIRDGCLIEKEQI